MQVVRGTGLFVVVAILLTFASVAIAFAAPARADSRDVLVISLFFGGVGFALLAGLEWRRLYRASRPTFA